MSVISHTIPLSSVDLSLYLYHSLQYHLPFSYPSRRFCKVAKHPVDRWRWTTCVRILVAAHEAWRGATAIVFLTSRSLVVVIVVVAVYLSLLWSLSLLSPSRHRHYWCYRRLVVIIVVGVSAPRPRCHCWRLIWWSGWSNLSVWKELAYRQKNRYNHFRGPVGLRTFWTQIWHPIFLAQLSKFQMRWLKSVLM